eukprot:108914_1
MRVKHEDITSIIIEAFCLICILFMLYDFTCKHGFRIWTFKTNKIISVIIMLCFVSFAIHSTTNTIYSITSTINSKFNAYWCLSIYNELWWWVTGKFATYLFFMVRLNEVFGTSSFAVSKSKLIALSIFICIPNIVYALIVNINLYKSQKYVSNSNNDCSSIKSFDNCFDIYYSFRSQTFAIMQYIGVCYYLLSEIIFCITILRLFLTRIITLTTSVEENSNTKTTNKKFLQLAIKTTNLMAAAFVFNINGLVNVLAVYLSYKYTNKYYKILCKPCKCYKICQNFFLCCCLPSNIKNESKPKSNQKTISENQVEKTEMDNKTNEPKLPSIENKNSNNNNMDSKDKKPKLLRLNLSLSNHSSRKKRNTEMELPLAVHDAINTISIHDICVIVDHTSPENKLSNGQQTNTPEFVANH